MTLLLLFKTTLLFSLALACLAALRRATSATRHLLCAGALTTALLLPLTRFTPQFAPLHVAPVTFIATSVAASTSQTWALTRPLQILWLCGFVLCLVRLALGYFRVASILRTATPSDGFLLADISVPMAVGLVNPAILMPRDAESWPLSRRTAALQHERAHLHRRDLLTNLIAHLACALYWFHPLAWVLTSRLRAEQEAACDDAVLATGFEPASYAEALIASAQQIASNNLIGCHMTQTTLKSRIARLFEDGLPRTASPATLRRTAIAVVAMAAIIAMLNGSPRARAAQARLAQSFAPQAQAAAAPAPPTPAAASSPETQATPAEQPGPAANPLEMGDGISPPKLNFRTEPAYTEDAKAAKISGTVLLTLIVGTDGLAHNIEVARGIDPGLDQNAIDAIKQWQFQPATKDGENVAVHAKIEVNFKLL